MAGHSKAIVLNPKDNVVTAIADLEAGAVIRLKINGRPVAVTLTSNVPAGHKFALRDLKKGEAVIKYGEPIGQTTEDVLSGENVHVHNVMSRPRGGL